MSLSIRYFAALLASAALVSAADFRNGQAAWAVIGQPNFTAQIAPPSQNVTGAAGGLAWVNGKLLISEGNRVSATSIGADGSQTPGNRVMIFDGTSPNYLPNPRSDVAVTGNSGNARCPVCGFSATNVIGQPNFNSTAVGLQNGFRNPTAVASDGTLVAVADTDNNRVLLWRSFPTTNGQPPDLVLGQPDFATVQLFAGVHNNTLRGPQGVWIQRGKLFVADTQNHRVLIWNSIPTQNQQAADVVLGQKDFESAEAPSGALLNPPAAQNRLYSPTSATSDGVRLYVSDLGFNRVLIWNSIPTGIDQPADVVIGQPNFVASNANNSSAVCASEGNDSNNNPIFPARCEKTLNFPRYALSDGKRLFIADGGNDRVLIYNTIPTANTPAADIVLGQPDFTSDIVSDPTVQFASTTIPNRASTNTVRTPTSLAWDGTNLYVTDPFDLRVLVFTAGDDNRTLSDNSILNAASLSIFQQGVVAIGGTINANDTVTITINNTAVANSTSKSYTYTVKTGDTVATVAQGLVTLINASPGDPNVTALSNQFGQILLTSRQSQLPNNSISLSASVSTGAQLTAVASGSYLTGGNAAVIAPGTLVVINGQNLTDGSSVPATPGATSLPTTLGGAQVYMDGVAAPLVSVSPKQIEAQVPYTFQGANSASIFVRTTSGGSAQITNAAPIIIAQANPGIFAGDGNDPRPAVALHSSDKASAVVSVDGSITAGNTGTITIGSNSYTYKVQASDTLATVRDALIAQIQSDPNVTPSAGGQFTRVVLTARTAGPGGNGIPVSASTSSGAALVLTAYTSSTCCASTPMAPVTPSNPAQPNETITLLTTGLGPLVDAIPVAGQAFGGSVQNTVTETVSATLAGSTAQVINAGVPHNGIGVYQVDIIIPSGVSADSNAQVYIAQDAFVSNIATLPVAGSGNPLVTFTASPNVIVTSGQYGQTTLNWNAPGIQTVEIHIGAPDGALFALGGSQGSAATGNWVVDGTTFYLEDVTNGKLPNTVNTLASLTVRLGTPQSVTSFSGTDVNIPTGYSFAPSTLTWNAPASSKIEIHAGSPNGPLFTVGNSSGSVTTGNWVTTGTVLYLVDVSDPNNPFVLKSITFGGVGGPAVAFNVPPKFTIEPGATTSQSSGTTTSQSSGTITSQSSGIASSPIPAPYSPMGYFGVAKISWDSPLTPNVEVHVGSPTGPVFTFGGTQGSGITGPWVTNGMQFYLQDVSNGFPLTSAHTLAVATAAVVPQVEQGYLLLAQGPTQNPSGQPYGSATLNWSTTTATNVEVHVGSPNGPLFTGGGPRGSATASGWVTNGMTFFLQDTSNGEPLTSDFTIATQTVNFVPYTPVASFQASPNPILVAKGTLYGTTTLYWNSPAFGNVEIHIGSPDGRLLAQGLSTGSVTTGPWVTDGMTFYLQDVTNHNPLTLDHTLAVVQAHLQAPQ